MVALPGRAGGQDGGFAALLRPAFAMMFNLSV